MQSDHTIEPLYVLDTDTVTAEQQARPSVLQRLTQVAHSQVMTTVVTMSEQLRGRLAEINRAQDAASLRRAYERLQFTQHYYCTATALSWDEAATEVYQMLLARRLRIGAQDLRIAAIVLAKDATLVTGNRRDFERVPELRLEDWTVA